MSYNEYHGDEEELDFELNELIELKENEESEDFYFNEGLINV